MPSTTSRVLRNIQTGSGENIQLNYSSSYFTENSPQEVLVEKSPMIIAMERQLADTTRQIDALYRQMVVTRAEIDMLEERNPALTRRRP
jgi:hypothetical protein